MKTIRYIVAAVLMMGSLNLWAQWRPYHEAVFDTVEDFDTISFPRWEPHLSVGMGFFSSSFGDSRVFTSVAPSLSYRPNDRLTVNGGFRVISDFGVDKVFASPAPVRNLAPYRNNGGTGMVGVHLGAEYQVNDNVWLAATLYHLGGSYAPIYAFTNGNDLDVSITALTAEAAFRFKNDNFLHLSVTVMRDRGGALPYMWHDAFMTGHGAWGMGGMPCAWGMASPYWGGWYY